MFSFHNSTTGNTWTQSISSSKSPYWPYLQHQNLDTNPFVDNVPTPSPRYILHIQYMEEIEYPYEEYPQLLTEQQNIGWDDFLCGKILKKMVNISTQL